MTALAQYRSGGAGGRTDNLHIPVPSIVDALDAAFYAAFENIVPAGKRTQVWIDVSGSMDQPSSVTGLSSREAATAIGLFIAFGEPTCTMHAFDDRAYTIPIAKGQRISDVTAYMRWSGGATDCALPMLRALAVKEDVDTFVVLTDSETWAGRTKPVDALRQYRATTGIPAKLVVGAMTASPFSIADPNDGGMLDIVGFDAHAPRILTDFSRGAYTETIGEDAA